MKIYQMYFSPTGSSGKICKTIANAFKDELNVEILDIDFTKKQTREKTYSFNSEDIVIFACPTYAGRVPNVLLPFLKENIKGNLSKVLPIVTFGNRNFDESLNELVMILRDNNFINIGALAFPANHSFSDILGKGRPNEDDLKKAHDYALKCTKMINSKEDVYFLPKDYEIKPYYRPKDSDGNFINILKVKPKTLDLCTGCGICQNVCPMGSIKNCKEIVGICIKCNACVKKCPANAKYFDDLGYLYHKKDLEDTFSAVKEIFLY